MKNEVTPSRIPDPFRTAQGRRIPPGSGSRTPRGQNSARDPLKWGKLILQEWNF